MPATELVNLPGDEFLAGAQFALVATLVEERCLCSTRRPITWDRAGGGDLCSQMGNYRFNLAELVDRAGRLRPCNDLPTGIQCGLDRTVVHGGSTAPIRWQPSRRSTTVNSATSCRRASWLNLVELIAHGVVARGRWSRRVPRVAGCFACCGGP